MAGRIGGLKHMPREDLAKRDRWQHKTGARGESPECNAFGAIMKMHLENSKIEVIDPPKDLRGIYGSQPHNQNSHGVEPKFCLHNTENDKKNLCGG